MYNRDCSLFKQNKKSVLYVSLAKIIIIYNNIYKHLIT